MDYPIIEGIKALTFTLKVRDRVTNEVHELELRGRGPWDLANLEKILAEPGATVKAKGLPPPDSAITLKLDNRDGKRVRVAATGAGAKAWIQVQGTLLGARWILDDRGAPIVLLEDSPSILADIAKALPEVTIDTTHYIVGDAAGTVVPARTTKRAAVEEAEESKRTAVPAAPEPSPAPPAEAKKSPREPAPRAESKPARKRKSHKALTPGLGAGNLTWTETDDADNPGLIAPWKDGRFKILHAGGDMYALFYEHHDGEGYDKIACGPVDALKLLAGERTVTEFGQVDLDAARRLCGVTAPAASKPESVKAEPVAPDSPELAPAPPVPSDEAPVDKPVDDAAASKQAMEALRNMLEDVP